MKIVFVGPTLPDYASQIASGISVRPPAQQGDLARAVDEGAQAIGLIDGLFEMVSPVWHKEILFALSKGVAVFGGASMGALRAAECAAFGMTAVGKIANAYLDGRIEDDCAVAQLHGPQETGYLQLSEPLVNIEFTLEHLLTLELIDAEEADALRASARSIFFKELSFASVLASVGGLTEGRRSELKILYRTHKIDQKRRDALAVLQALEAWHPDNTQRSLPWHFAENDQWREFRNSASA